MRADVAADMLGSDSHAVELHGYMRVAPDAVPCIMCVADLMPS